MSRYPLFDRQQIRLRALSDRGHDLPVQDCLDLDADVADYAHPDLKY